MAILNTIQHILRHPLNRSSRFQALARYAKWQVGSRMVPGPVAISLTPKARLLVSRGMYGATQNIYCGLNDFGDMGFLLHCLRAKDVFVDVGANVGAYTILASAQAGATTHSFEPSRSALDALLCNVSLNRIADRVTVHDCALGGSEGEALLTSAGPDAMHHIAAGADGGSMVKIRTLDSFGLRPRVIKIDVEGYESEVLSGASETLDRPELLAVLTENSDDGSNYSSVSVSEVMARHGFVPCSYDPAKRSLTTGQVHADNALYVRGFDETQALVQAADPFTVLGQLV